MICDIMLPGVLALITARGGSKGIPRKNLALVGGRPLLAWSVAACRSAVTVDRIILTTDDVEIAQLGSDLGAEVPFMRPSELARDDTTSVEVVLHALESLAALGDPVPELMVLIQPTSPLRTAEDIDNAVAIARGHPGATVVSVSPVRTHPNMAYMVAPDGTLTEYMDHPVHHRRQELEPLVEMNGAIYVLPCQKIFDEASIFSGQMIAYEMPLNRSLDVDTDWDLDVADMVLSRTRS